MKWPFRVAGNASALRGEAGARLNAQTELQAALGAGSNILKSACFNLRLYIAVDPDAPSRVGDGSGPGDKSPILHWLLTDCSGWGRTLVEFKIFLFSQLQCRA